MTQKLSDEALYELHNELRELMAKYNAAVTAEDDEGLHGDYRDKAARDADDISRRIREIELEIEENEPDDETWLERFARHAAFGKREG